MNGSSKQILTIQVFFVFFFGRPVSFLHNDDTKLTTYPFLQAENQQNIKEKKINRIGEEQRSRHA